MLVGLLGGLFMVCCGLAGVGPCGEVLLYLEVRGVGVCLVMPLVGYVWLEIYILGIWWSLIFIASIFWVCNCSLYTSSFRTVWSIYFRWFLVQLCGWIFLCISHKGHVCFTLYHGSTCAAILIIYEVPFDYWKKYFNYFFYLIDVSWFLYNKSFNLIL